jgi:hypothetical protein
VVSSSKTRTSKACRPPSALWAQTTVTSPKALHFWQSDVETVHRLVEDEFFDRETFSGPADFWRKVTTYWHYFNLVRPNRGMEWRSPLQILKATAPALAGAVLNWRPLNLAKRHIDYLPPPQQQGS